MYKVYLNSLMLVCGLVVCVATPLRPYVAPEALRSRKFIISAFAGSAACVLLGLWARRKLKMAQTEEERRDARRLMRLCAVLGIGAAGAGAYGAFSKEDDRALDAVGLQINSHPMNKQDSWITLEDIETAGFDINRLSTTSNGEQLSLLASVLDYSEDPRVAPALIRKGASVTVGFGKGRNAFQFAVWHKAVPAMEALVETHRELINEVDGDGKTPLMWAVCFGDLRIVKMLIDAGASMTIGLPHGDTLLHYACKENLAVAQYLIQERGFDKFAVDHEGQTILHLLARRQGPHGAAMARLACSGVPPEFINQKDSTGTTALHRAAATGKSDLVRLLVEAGADVNCVDNKGSCPVDCGLNGSGSKMRCCLYLLDHGARLADGTARNLFFCSLLAFNPKIEGRGDVYKQIVLQLLERGVPAADLFSAFKGLIKRRDVRKIQFLVGKGCFERLSLQQQNELFVGARRVGGDKADEIMNEFYW